MKNGKIEKGRRERRGRNGWEYVEFSKDSGRVLRVLLSDKELGALRCQIEGWEASARERLAGVDGAFEALINEGLEREAQAVEAGQLAEAVPAGQLYLKGFGKRSSGNWAGKLSPLANVPVSQLDDEKIVYELIQLAGRYLPADKIHVDETCNAELWHRSRVKWDTETSQPKELEAYYHTKAVRLPVLAHEVGHLETLPKLGAIYFYRSNAKNQYHAEVQASRWALSFLKSRGLKGTAYAEAVNLLQGCLDNYKKELGVPVRYVLDDTVENQNKKGGC